MKNKICREIISLTLFALLFLQLPAQQKALKIGDAIPEKVWTTPLSMVNSPNKTTTLATHRDKLILLDFWATWCSACLLNFPGMEALQQKFGDRIRMLPVTDQNRVTIEKFFATKNGQRFKHLSSVVGDQMFTNYFPHKGVPFFVWIKDGKLINTTDAEQVTEENITKVLKGETTALQTVVQMDRTRPLMLAESFDRQKNITLLNYSIFTKGHIPDIGGGGTFRYTATKKVNGRQFTNLPLYDMYFALGYELFNIDHVRESFTAKRMIIEVKDPKKLFGVSTADGLYEGSDLYSYELIVPEDQADSLYGYMLQDLNRYSPLKVKLEKRPVKCLVLKRSSATDKLATKGGEYRSSFPRTPSVLQNAPLKDMVNMLNGESGLDLPIIDETDYTGKVDLKVSGIRSLEQLIKELAAYDLELVETVKDLEMMVVRDR